MKWNVRLDPKELDALADDLLKYAETFEEKVRIFLSRLADLGIKVAQANGGVFGGYIVYSKEFETDNGNMIVNMVAKDSTSITNTWYVSSKSAEPRQETISPLLMAEFGSGRYAITAEGEAAGLGGQGTLEPNYGHAFDSNGWYWWTDDVRKDGEIQKVKNGRYLFHSDGLPPYQPLHNAVKACIEQVNGIAQEVFA